MAPSCLSRLLLILLVGATHVVAHPLNMDSPSPVVVARSPCRTGGYYKNKYKDKDNEGNVTWKAVIEEMYENENKYKHGDHDDKEPTDEAYEDKWKDAWKDALEKYKNKNKSKHKHGNHDDEEPKDGAYSHKNKNKNKNKNKHGDQDDEEPSDKTYKDKYKDAWKDTWEKFKNEQKNKYKPHGDKYASKYRPEENGVKESTKTEYPEEVSSKDDKKTETTHKGEKYKSSKSKNNKDDQEDLDYSAQKSNKYAIDHDSESQFESKVVKSFVKNPKNGKRSEKEKARQVLKNNRDGKSKHGQGSKYPGVKGKKKKTNKSGGRTVSLLDILTGGKGRLLFKIFEKKKRPKYRPKGPQVPSPGFSAKHHKNGLAPTEEKGVQQKAKISPRCGILPFWAWLLIGDKIGRNREAKKKNKQIKELEEAKKKQAQKNGLRKGPRLIPTWVTDPLVEKEKLKEKFRKLQKEKQKKPSSKLIPNFDGETSKVPVKKPIKEKENVKEKVSAPSGKESDSSETQQKKTKENKQM
ncbi:uncharacterized protein FSUBG_9984 [Fusarium subglutinans]|uniref:Uncharacterized protein n=1 Tax=Gibberella subglutinans TaxID=42677 RepID=A0A8H5UNI9_GIBSU|nr:uncharacterized protein FSUBG_9984 [Fusarium subglutinans]KAF5592938.1 hypothetical protein FSUBG_9984 [Fusarium subglutinans]